MKFKYLNDILINWNDSEFNDSEKVLKTSSIKARMTNIPAPGIIPDKLAKSNLMSKQNCKPKSIKRFQQLLMDVFNICGPGTLEEPIDLNWIDISKIKTGVLGGFSRIAGYWVENIWKIPGTGYGEYIPFEYIDVSKWNVFDCISLQDLLGNPYLISTGDLSKWDVSYVQSVHGLFFKCENLKYIGNISKWDVSNISDFGCMFHGCENLEFIGDLSNWNTKSLKTLYCTFSNCLKLKTLGDLNKWSINTSQLDNDFRHPWDYDTVFNCDILNPKKKKFKELFPNINYY